MAICMGLRICKSKTLFIYSLQTLKNKGPYDCIFSNFAGLNCTDKLDQVLAGFDELLKPGGMVVLVILPRFCLWESLFYSGENSKQPQGVFLVQRGEKRIWMVFFYMLVLFSWLC